MILCCRTFQLCQLYNSVYSIKRDSSTQVTFSCITLFSIAGLMIEIQF